MFEDPGNRESHEPESALQSAPQRLAGLDMARGLAYFGMVAVNLHLVMTWGRAKSSLQPAWLEAGIESLFGRAAATFVLIAGIGLSLRYRRLDQSRVQERPRLILSRIAFLLFLLVAIFGTAFHILRDRILGQANIGGLGRHADWLGLLANLEAFVARPIQSGSQTFLAIALSVWVLLALLLLTGSRLFAGLRGELFLRALFLFATGYLWQPIWSGDILHFYGLWLVLALPFLRLPALLFAILFVLLISGGLWLHILWDYGDSWSPTLEHLQFWTWRGQIRDLLFDGWHPLFPWFGFLLAGLMLGRCQLERKKAPLRALALGFILFLAAAPLSNWVSKDVIGGYLRGPETEAAEIETPGPQAPRPPGWLSRQRVGVESEIKAPSLIAAAEFVAGRLKDEPIENFALRMVDGKSRLELKLKAGLSRDQQDAVRSRLLSWYLGPRTSEEPIWPESLKTLEVQIPSQLGHGSTSVFDREKDRSLPTDLELSQLFSLEAIPPGPFFFMEALGTAMMLVSGALLLLRSPLLLRLAHPVVQTGKVAFSLYIFHVIFGMGILDLLNLLQGQNLLFTTLVIVVLNLLSMAFACAWLALFKRGPVEALMRWLCR